MRRLAPIGVLLTFTLLLVLGCSLFDVAPVAIFTATSSYGQSPVRVVFNASASYDPDGAIAGYEWDFGDGSKGENRVTSHEYKIGGTCNVCLTVTDDAGRTGTTIQSLTFHAVPTARFEVVPPASFGLVGSSVRLDASGSTAGEGSILAYLWDFGDGATGEGKTVEHTYPGCGRYRATLTVVDSGGASDSAYQMIVVPESPTTPGPRASLVASPTSGVPPLTVRFDASGSTAGQGTIVSYSWSFGDGATDAGVIVTHAYAIAGTYTAHVTVTQSDGGTDSATQQIAVSAASPPSGPRASLTASPTSGTVPLAVHFNASASSAAQGGIASYSWSFGDGATGSGVAVDHTYTSAGAYTARVTVTDTQGSTDSATQTIQVTTVVPPSGPHASLTASPTSGAAPLAVSFDGSGSSAGQGSIVSYSWSFGDGATGTGATISHTYTSSGTYAARLTVTNSGSATDSATQTIQVSGPTPPPQVTWHTIARWTGKATKNTETFHIPSQEWRISWSTEPGEYGPMNFIIWVYTADGAFVDLAANVIGADTDSSVMRGSGDYYLNFLTGQPYEVTVEAWY